MAHLIQAATTIIEHRSNHQILVVVTTQEKSEWDKLMTCVLFGKFKIPPSSHEGPCIAPFSVDDLDIPLVVEHIKYENIKFITISPNAPIERAENAKLIIKRVWPNVGVIVDEKSKFQIFNIRNYTHVNNSTETKENTFFKEVEQMLNGYDVNHNAM
jgi:hypothetical protein